MERRFSLQEVNEIVKGIGADLLHSILRVELCAEEIPLSESDAVCKRIYKVSLWNRNAEELVPVTIDETLTDQIIAMFRHY